MSEEAAPPPAGDEEALPLFDAQTLGRDLLSAMVDEIKAAPDCWQKMSEAQQDQCITRLQNRVKYFLAAALRILVSGQYPATPATLTSISSRKGIRVLLGVARNAPNRHQLLDAIDQDVLLVVARHDDYTGRMNEIKADASQGDLFKSGVSFGEGYTGADDRPFRRDEPGLKDPDDVDSPAQGITYDPDAPAPDLELAKGELWEQAVEALGKAGVVVDPEIAKGWTDAQCAQAAYWAGRKAADPDVTPDPPPFVQEAIYEDGPSDEDDEPAIDEDSPEAPPEDAE